jgi:hypothetical protein
VVIIHYSKNSFKDFRRPPLVKSEKNIFNFFFNGLNKSAPPTFYIQFCPLAEEYNSNTKVSTTMNLSTISKGSEVDNLLKFTTKRKDDLVFRQIVLNREKSEMSESVTDIDTELAKVNAKIVASNAILGVLTDTEELRDENLKKERLDVRRKGLENRREDANVMALIMLDFELEEIAVRITKTNELISGLNTRKTELGGA